MATPPVDSDTLGRERSPAAASPTAPHVRDPLADEGAALSRGRFRFLILALILGVLAVGWTVQDEVIHSSIQVGNAVPPIPALTALLVLAGVAFFAYRRGRKSFLGRGRILRTYILITLAAAIPSTASM